MEGDLKPEDVIELNCGLSIATGGHFKPVVNWDDVRRLCEAGMTFAAAGKLFHLKQQVVYKKAQTENWVVQVNIDRRRRELSKQIALEYGLTGKVLDPVEAKARMWEERGEKVREDIYQIADTAIEGLKRKKRRVRNMIKTPKDLVDIAKATREATGLEQKEAMQGPQMAVNIGFLKSGMVPVPVAGPGAVDVPSHLLPE